ncbi:MAG: hypothetical protein ABR538_09150 [Candidatus Binatia bacterium]
MKLSRAGHRAEILVFLLVLLSAGYFHQGGGWNQNSRFALVRAVVEDATFFIDDYLLYRRGDASDANAPLIRTPIARGNFERDGREYALAWRARDGSLLPVDPSAAEARPLVAVDAVAASGDIAYHDGHFHPNKAPGTSFLAVPAWSLVCALASLAGVPVDSWAALTYGAWLVSLLSVGLATAAGAVLVLRLARGFGSEQGARLAALAFAFCTMAWPFSTFLFKHNIIAVFLVASVYAVENAGRAGRRRAGAMHAAGLLAGFSAITNYTMVAFVPMVALFALARGRSLNDLVWFAAGLVWPLLAIGFYNQVCFGTPVATNYSYQSAMFMTDNRFLGVFAVPRGDVLVLLLFSPFRGLFFTSPVLLAAVAALFVLKDRSGMRPWVVLIAAVGGFLLLVNASFNGWDGGWTAVPRYLAPAMGLLALPLAFAFDRWKAVTVALASVSFLIQGLLTAVDPQVPLGDVGTAGVQPAEVFTLDPMTRYVVPLFVRERAWPLLDESIEAAVARAGEVARQRGIGAAGIQQKSEELRRDLRARVERAEPLPLPLGAVRGPVSANPVGVYEGFYFQVFAANTRQATGNSFNVGEFLFPRSRLSLLPLLLLGGILGVLLLKNTAQESSPPPAGEEREP